MVKGLVSIIVPSYNVEKNIPYCLNSLIAQTYENIEIICVNDGSKDGTADVIEKYSEKDSRVKLINQSNAGVSAARNTGIDAAEGEYIAFADSDDFVDRRFIARLLELMTEHSADIARCRGRGVKDYDYVEPEPENPPVVSERNTKEALEIYYDGVFYGWYADDASVIWNCLYKADILKNIRFDSSIYKGEDDCFIQMALGEAEKVVYTDERLYFYYYNEIGLTHNKSHPDDALKRLASIYGNHRDYFRKKGFSEIGSKSAECACNNFCEIYTDSDNKEEKKQAVKLFKDFYRDIDSPSLRLKLFYYLPRLYKVLIKLRNKKAD